MKRFYSLFVAICLSVIPLGIVGCGSGCQSTTRTTYVASGATHVGVVTALKGWDAYLGQEDARLAELAKTDKAKADKERSDIADKNKQVRDAYAKYQASQIAVLTAAQEFAKVPANDPNAPGAQDRLSVAVAASSATLATLLDLLKTFGVKVQ